MGIYLEVEDLDAKFHQKTQTPMVINDISSDSEADKERLNRLILTKYSTDFLSNLPQCECGEIVGEHCIGVTCKVCNTPVTSPMNQSLEPLLWMRAPKGVEALINPAIWSMMNAAFKVNGFELIRWLCDKNYKPPVKTPPVVETLQSMGLQQGYNNFIRNFDQIWQQLLSLRVFKAKRQIQDIAELDMLIREKRNIIFPQHLPLPNRALLVIETNNTGTWVDPIVTGAVDAIRTMQGIDTKMSTHPQWIRENRTIKALVQYAKFQEDLYRTVVAKKDGVLRKHVYGTRCNWSFRSVITSNTGVHEYDELHISWGIGVSVFSIHLTNKLIRRGFTPNEIKAFLYEHAQKYHVLLDELFVELIKESPYKGIPVVFQRNPSLERGSAQAMFVTKIKTDVMVPTVSLSILSVVGYNADFDGDQLNGTVSLDNMTAEELRGLAPHMSVFGLDEPRAVSRNLSMPKPVISSIANMLDTPEEVDPVKLQRMMALPDA